jgi:hypothetical protein
MFFDENARAGDWRERVLHCRDNGVSINRDIAFAVAVADLLQLPVDLPLMPAVKAVMSVTTRLSDRASLAHLRAVARAAGCEALADADKRPLPWASPVRAGVLHHRGWHLARPHARFRPAVG